MYVLRHAMYSAERVNTICSASERAFRDGMLLPSPAAVTLAGDPCVGHTNHTLPDPQSWAQSREPMARCVVQAHGECVCVDALQSRSDQGLEEHMAAMSGTFGTTALRECRHVRMIPWEHDKTKSQTVCHKNSLPVILNDVASPTMHTWVLKWESKTDFDGVQRHFPTTSTQIARHSHQVPV